ALGDRTPVTRLKSVVFPAPFGPITAWMAPASTESATSATAVKPPNDFVSPSTASTLRALRHARDRAGTRAAHEAPRAPDHQCDQERAGEGQPPLLDPAQRLGAQRDGGGRRHGAPEAPHAAQEHDDEDLRGAMEAELGGVDEQRVVRVEGTAHAGHERAEREHRELEPGDVDAHDLRGELVLAQRLG